MGRVKRFAMAVRKWQAAGCPVRDDEAVEEIFENKCKPCEHFVEKRNDRGKCGLCGCQLNLGNGLNKIRWATESCPADKWFAWVEEDGTLTDYGRQAKRRGYEIPKEPGRMAREPVEMSDEQREQEAKKAERDARKRAREQRAKRREERRQKRARRREREEKERAEMTERQLFDNRDPLRVYNSQKHDATLRDLWRYTAGFLVCGGPSLRDYDLSFLKERGVVSLGINNVAGYAPVRAMTFSDPPEKFHHGIFLDPAMIKLVPVPKLKKQIRIKHPDGTFERSKLRVKDCPNVWAYQRDCYYEPKTFLTQDGASWGNNNKGVEKTGRPKILFTFFLGLRLMHYLGVRRVYLIGADFNMSEAAGAHNNYAFKEERWKGAIAGNNNHYRRANEMCHELRPYLEKAGFHVFNCNPRSRLSAFDFVPLDVAIEDCRNEVPREPFDLTGWYRKDGDKPDLPDDRGEGEDAPATGASGNDSADSSQPN